MSFLDDTAREDLRAKSLDILVLFKELRRRFRYLRHLPLTCEFAICELDLKPSVLSWETLNHFKGKKDNRCYLFTVFSFLTFNQGWIQHELVGGGAVPPQMTICRVLELVMSPIFENIGAIFA